MEQLYNIIRQLGPQIQRPNPKDPKWAARMQKAIQIAKTLQRDPNMPPDIGQLVNTLLYETVAFPEVSGIKTTIQGNKWELLNPTRPPLHRKH